MTYHTYYLMHQKTKFITLSFGIKIPMLTAHTQITWHEHSSIEMLIITSSASLMPNDCQLDNSDATSNNSITLQKCH